MNFDRKVIWITGASSGVGEYLTYAFAQLGAILILSSRNQGELERVKNNCKKPEEVHILPLDVTDFEQVGVTAQKAIELHDRIDILVNNAGVSQRAFAKDSLLDVDQRIMNVNYLGTVAVTKAVLPQFLKQQSGQIVVMSSVTGKLGTPKRSAYAASKHALHGFFDSLRAESYDDNLKVTILCPGYIQTNISINALTGDGSKYNTKKDKTQAGLAPDVFAQKALKAIYKQREEVYIGGQEIMGIYLKRFFPKVLSRIVRKVKVS